MHSVFTLALRLSHMQCISSSGVSNVEALYISLEYQYRRQHLREIDSPFPIPLPLLQPKPSFPRSLPTRLPPPTPSLIFSTPHPSAPAPNAASPRPRDCTPAPTYHPPCTPTPPHISISLPLSFHFSPTTKLPTPPDAKKEEKPRGGSLTFVCRQRSAAAGSAGYPLFPQRALLCGRPVFCSRRGCISWGCHGDWKEALGSPGEGGGGGGQ